MVQIATVYLAIFILMVTASHVRLIVFLMANNVLVLQVTFYLILTVSKIKQWSVLPILKIMVRVYVYAYLFLN